MKRLRRVVQLCSGLLLATTARAEPENQRLLPIAFYTPDTSFGIGGFLVRDLDHPTEGDPSQLLSIATFTARKQSLVIIEPKFYADGGRWEWSFKASYQDFPSNYFGREEAILDKEEAYEDVRWTGTARLKRVFFRGLFWAVELEATRMRMSAPDESPAIQAEIARWGTRSQMLSRQLSIGYDDRNIKARPTSGSLITAYTRALDYRTTKAEGEPRQYGFEAKHYLSLSESQTVALQVGGAQLQREDVPFHLLPGLGGNQILRGYLGNQYRDFAIGFAQGEYRHIFRPQWGYRLFVGTGGHAPDLKDLPERRFYTGGGVGGDYFLDARNRTNLRFDLGYGEDGVRVYFLYGNAF